MELFSRKILHRQLRTGIRFANPIDNDPKNITHGGPRVWHVNTVMNERMSGGEEAYAGALVNRDFKGIGQASGFVNSSFRFSRLANNSPTIAAVVGSRSPGNLGNSGSGDRPRGRDRALPLSVRGSGPTSPGGEPIFDWVSNPGDDE